MSDTTDAAAHAKAIREHLTAIRQHPHGRPEPRNGHVREIDRHLAALDAARIAAEQRADAMTDRVWRILSSEPVYRWAAIDANEHGEAIYGWQSWSLDDDSWEASDLDPARRGRDADAEAQP